MSKIQLGDLVKDKVTGFKGVAVARTTWISGCDRINVQPVGVDKSGKLYEPQSFDEPLLEIIKKQKTKEQSHKTGGPQLTMKRI